MLEDYSRARICVQTFVREEDLPPGQQLLTCSKCGITCYLNREAQRKNWKYHKKVCCLLVEDDKRIQKPIPTFAEAKALFSELLENPQEKIKGRLFLHVFQELTRHLNENDRYAFLKGDAFDKVFSRDLIEDLLGNFTGKGDSLSHILMAIPGFASYLFSDDLLVAKNGPTSTLSRSYVKMITHLIIMCCMWERDLVDGPLSAALVRRSMNWWTSEAVQKSCPYLSRGVGFYLLLRASTTIFELGPQRNGAPRPHIVGPIVKAATQPNEFAPGMSVKAMLTILMKDNRFVKLSVDYDLELLLQSLILLSQKKNTAWNYLSCADRVELLDLYHDWKSPLTKKQDKSIHASYPMNAGFSTSIQYMITGFSTEDLLKLNDYLRAIPASEQHPKTAKLFRHIRSILMDTDHHSSTELQCTKLFVDIVESQFRKKNRHFPGTIQQFPEELVYLITEYCLDDNYWDYMSCDTEHLSATVEPGIQNIIDTYSDFAAMVDGMSNEQFLEAMREMGLSCSPQELFKAMKKQGRMG